MSTVAIKIECQCGQRYAFDVEPIAGRMPSFIACPVCGADGTAIANEMLSRGAVDPRAGSAVPDSVELAAQPAIRTEGRRRVPTPRPLAQDEATRDLLEAKLDIKRATSAALIVAGLDILVGILRLCGIPISDVDHWILVTFQSCLGWRTAFIVSVAHAQFSCASTTWLSSSCCLAEQA
jgi:hypothetical protein